MIEGDASGTVYQRLDDDVLTGNLCFHITIERRCSGWVAGTAVCNLCNGFIPHIQVLRLTVGGIVARLHLIEKSSIDRLSCSSAASAAGIRSAGTEDLSLAVNVAVGEGIIFAHFCLCQTVQIVCYCLGIGGTIGLSGAA